MLNQAPHELLGVQRNALPAVLKKVLPTAPASERRENTSNGVENFPPESQGQDLALTVLYVPCSLASGPGPSGLIILVSRGCFPFQS